MLVDSTQVIHRASIPNKDRTRTMMVLSFALNPDIEGDIFYYNNKSLGSVWDIDNHKIVNYLAKPVGVRKLFSLYKKLSKNFNL